MPSISLLVSTAVPRPKRTFVGDSKISLLTVDGSKVEYAKRDLSAGIRPYDIDLTGSATAIVGNVGASGGDNDTISLIDMRAEPIRVVTTVTVGQTPEAVKMSPDGNNIR